MRTDVRTLRMVLGGRPYQAGGMSGHINVRSSHRSVLRKSARWLSAVALGTVCLCPGVVAAQTQTSSDPVTTPEQAQAAFTSTGYQVDPIQTWGWTTPSVRSFEVHDPATQRVLMVLVFPTAGDAALLRGEMALHQESATSNPYLVSGYGPSMWSGNIAMMESNESHLERVAQLQADQNNGVYDSPEAVLDARAPNITVDVDFQRALQISGMNL